jgi:hypothetical protein
VAGDTHRTTDLTPMIGRWEAGLGGARSLL